MVDHYRKGRKEAKSSKAVETFAVLWGVDRQSWRPNFGTQARACACALAGVLDWGGDAQLDFFRCRDIEV